jgi:SAM-dependent methyltransferase
VTPASRPGGQPAAERPYSAGMLTGFAGDEHARFLASGGRRLRPRLARALALADLWPGAVVVDVGCGRGEASARAARRGALVTAVDSSPDALGLSREAALAVGCPVRLVAARAEELPLPCGYADRVLLLDVVEHLYRPAALTALAEAKRILRPGGYVVLHTLPNRWSLAIAYRTLRLLAPSLPREPRSGYERAVHVNEQDPLRLKQALGTVGLASRVWVEEWTTRHAEVNRGVSYPDAARSAGYPALRRASVRRLSGWVMRTPAGWFAGNDLFALAWRPEDPGPPSEGRFAPVRFSGPR